MAKAKQLIVIVGPTAIGKTSLSIRLAQELKCPILSADSRQFFKEMAIGTAKPTSEELAQAEHHFVDFLSIEDQYSAGHFERDVLERLETIFRTHDHAILVGGSGLYINAVLFGFDDIPSDLQIREELMNRLEAEGLQTLVDELVGLDLEVSEFLDLNNTQRVVRALEICLASGKPYSSFRTNSMKERDFAVRVIGLDDDRQAIYDRINKRVDQMIEQGLVEEAKTLYPKRNLNALKTVGYREIFQHLDGEITLEEAIELIKKNTRNFAKRQLTWFRKNEAVEWVRAHNTPDILNFIRKEY